MIDLPTRKVGAANVPSFALSVRRQDESPFPCTDQYSYFAHDLFLLESHATIPYGEPVIAIEFVSRSAAPRLPCMLNKYLIVVSALLRLRRLPQPHHAPLGIREERERAHTGHLLLLDMDLASRFDDALAIGRKVVDGDVQSHVAWPRTFALRFQDAAVDAALAAGVNDAVVQFGHMLDLPVKNLLIEFSHLRRLLRHQFPVNNGFTHDDLLRLIERGGYKQLCLPNFTNTTNEHGILGHPPLNF